MFSYVVTGIPTGVFNPVLRLMKACQCREEHLQDDFKCSISSGGVQVV
jgi:hypothetical protein